MSSASRSMEAGTTPRQPVLFVSWNFPPRRGGIEAMVWHLFGHLSAAGPTTLLTGRAPQATTDPSGVARAPVGGLLGFLFWLLWRVPRELLAGRGQLILSSGALVGSVVEPMARLLGRPHAVIIYGTDLTYPSRLYQLWLRLFLPSVPKLLPISSVGVEELRARGFAGSEPLGCLPPGIDPAMVDEPFDDSLQHPGVPVLLFVGRVIERKGLEPFIEHCLPLILEQQPVELWVVGGEATQSLAHRAGALERVRSKLAGSALESRVRLFGSAPDEVLRAAYRHASLLVLPAIHRPGDVEGFGIVFLEAALFDVPAVSTRLGGIPDAVVDGETGVLVEADDWPAYAAAVNELLANDARRQRLAEQARERAVNRYDWRLISNSCYQFLEEARR